MKVLWEREDLVEIIMSFKTALCDIVSISGDHLALPIMKSDKIDQEALNSRMTSFLIANPHCSVLVASFAKPDSGRVMDMYRGFWVTTNVIQDTIRLSYRIIPKEFIKRELDIVMGYENTAP